MKNKSLLFAATIMFSISSVFAQTKSVESSCNLNSAINAVKFAKIGSETKSPELLIEAALITMNSPLRNLTVEKTVIDGKEVDASTMLKSPTFQLDAKELLVLAISYSGTNEDLKNYANELMKNYSDNLGKSRGKVGGAAFVSRSVKSEGSISDYIYFKGKEVAELSITPIGFNKSVDSDVNFYSKFNIVFSVYNSKGELIGEASNFWGNGVISFTPDKTEVYEVRTTNKGDKNVDFIILTN